MYPDNGIRLSRIVSGGQTGVDRAALDCAIAHEIAHGGWCPAGRLAEDGAINSRYALTETETTDYQTRTRLNVKDSDGTLILSAKPLEGGTALTAELAEKLRKPYLVVDPAKVSAIPAVLEWLENNAIRTLNIAGPRASKQPDIYDQAYHFLDRLIESLHQ